MHVFIGCVSSLVKLFRILTWRGALWRVGVDRCLAIATHTTGRAAAISVTLGGPVDVAAGGPAGIMIYTLN